MELTQSKASEEGKIRLSCEADGVFPRPELTFIQKPVEYVLRDATNIRHSLKHHRDPWAIFLSFLTKPSMPHSSLNATVLDGAEVRVADRLDGLFDIEADMEVDAAMLDDGPEIVFGCELKIPDADISIVKWEKYESSKFSDACAAANISSLRGSNALLIYICSTRFVGKPNSVFSVYLFATVNPPQENEKWGVTNFELGPEGVQNRPNKLPVCSVCFGCA